MFHPQVRQANAIPSTPKNIGPATQRSEAYVVSSFHLDDVPGDSVEIFRSWMRVSEPGTQTGDLGTCLNAVV